MRAVVKILVGAAVAVGVSLPLLGGAYAVSNNPGTTYKGGPARVEWEPPIDDCKIAESLGAVPADGPFGSPWMAHQARLNSIKLCGHQPYTFPKDPYDL